MGGGGGKEFIAVRGCATPEAPQSAPQKIRIERRKPIYFNFLLSICEPVESVPKLSFGRTAPGHRGRARHGVYAARRDMRRFFRASGRPQPAIGRRKSLTVVYLSAVALGHRPRPPRGAGSQRDPKKVAAGAAPRGSQGGLVRQPHSSRRGQHFTPRAFNEAPQHFTAHCCAEVFRHPQAQDVTIIRDKASEHFITLSR